MLFLTNKTRTFKHLERNVKQRLANFKIISPISANLLFLSVIKYVCMYFIIINMPHQINQLVSE